MELRGLKIHFYDSWLGKIKFRVFHDPLSPCFGCLPTLFALRPPLSRTLITQPILGVITKVLSLDSWFLTLLDPSVPRSHDPSSKKSGFWTLGSGLFKSWFLTLIILILPSPWSLVPLFPCSLDPLIPYAQKPTSFDVEYFIVAPLGFIFGKKCSVLLWLLYPTKYSVFAALNFFITKAHSSGAWLTFVQKKTTSFDVEYFVVAPLGIEPKSQAPETCILSIVLWGQ